MKSIEYHKKEIRKWQQQAVKDSFDAVGSNLPVHIINEHKVAINQLNNNKK